jgi:hypothetical protein
LTQILQYGEPQEKKGYLCTNALRNAMITSLLVVIAMGKSQGLMDQRDPDFAVESFIEQGWKSDEDCITDDEGTLY